MIIEIDVEALVHDAWHKLPFWQRVVVRMLRLDRDKIEAECVRRLRGGSNDGPVG